MNSQLRISFYLAVDSWISSPEIAVRELAHWPLETWVVVEEGKGA